jgi:hypothetical protein
MLEPDAVPYLPEDMLVGSDVSVWNRKFVIYDCDDFTRNFYKDYMGIDQAAAILDVSPPQLKHAKLPPPPHNGVGREEDSLLNVLMVRPVPPKIDMVRMMTLSGEVLRFEAKMVNGQPEDDIRKLIVAFFPADDKVAVYEIPVRNSGIMGGKFAERDRIVNPATGKYIELTDLAVGKYVTIRSQPLLITRADEHTLQWTEANPDKFPFADPMRCALRLSPARDLLNDPAGVDPDTLKDMAASVGVDLLDHELITLLRFFCVDDMDGMPCISGPKVLAAMDS